MESKERILCEGKVYKYSPDINSIYTERWLQVTHKGVLRLYIDKISSLTHPQRPVLAVPIVNLEDVKKIHMTNRNLSKDIRKDLREKFITLNKNQFMLLYTDSAIKE